MRDVLLISAYLTYRGPDIDFAAPGQIFFVKGRDFPRCKRPGRHWRGPAPGHGPGIPDCPGRQESRAAGANGRGGKPSCGDVDRAHAVLPGPVAYIER